MENLFYILYILYTIQDMFNKLAIVYIVYILKLLGKIPVYISHSLRNVRYIWDNSLDLYII